MVLNCFLTFFLLEKKQLRLIYWKRKYFLSSTDWTRFLVNFTIAESTLGFGIKTVGGIEKQYSKSKYAPATTVNLPYDFVPTSAVNLFATSFAS